MTSDKQKEANIQNARFSTGPVTRDGKAVVARNAIRHGIFARDLVITAGDGREDLEEYEHLLAALIKNLAPLGCMEMLLVEKIAVNYWRLRRLVRYETGEIRERLDDFRKATLSSHYNGMSSEHQPELVHLSYNDEVADEEYQKQLNKVVSISRARFDLTKEKISLEYVLNTRLDKETVDFCDEDYEEARAYVQKLSPQLKGKLHKEMLAEAEQMLAEMVEVRDWQVKFDRTQKARSLPFERDLNKIIKYEGALERSVFRNLAVLKNLQESRTSGDEADDGSIEMPGLTG